MGSWQTIGLKTWLFPRWKKLIPLTLIQVIASETDRWGAAGGHLMTTSDT